MDIVKIQLIKQNTFWFLNDLHLGPGNKLSEPFDLDTAAPLIKEKINRAAVDFGIIKIVRQPTGTTPVLDINKDSSSRFELPKAVTKNIEPLQVTQAQTITASTPTANVDTDEEMPELQSATSEPEPEPKTEETLPSEEDYESARILLSRNGNTIKKAIRSFPEPKSEAKTLILACLELEKEGKQRTGLIKAFEEAFIGAS